MFHKAQFPKAFQDGDVNFLLIAPISSENKRIFSAAKLSLSSQRDSAHRKIPQAL
jgi:hypothetical protein